MEFRKLKGGKVIGINPDQLQIPLYADDPKMKVGTPGTIFGNVGLFVQMNECSKRQFGIPEPTLVKVIFRQIGTEVFLVMGIARSTGADVYEIKWELSMAIWFSAVLANKIPQLDWKFLSLLCPAMGGRRLMRSGIRQTPRALPPSGGSCPPAGSGCVRGARGGQAWPWQWWRMQRCCPTPERTGWT